MIVQYQITTRWWEWAGARGTGPPGGAGLPEGDEAKLFSGDAAALSSAAAAAYGDGSVVLPGQEMRQIVFM